MRITEVKEMGENLLRKNLEVSVFTVRVMSSRPTVDEDGADVFSFHVRRHLGGLDSDGGKSVPGWQRREGRGAVRWLAQEVQ